MKAARTLILLRHGKSGYPGGTRDHDRPVADRGQREAGLAGEWVRDTLPPVDAVLCSTALRARQTLDATGVSAPTRYLDELYEAAPGDIVEAIGGTSDDVDVLLVVGHAPGIPNAALTLADYNTDAAILEDLRARFPTSALAVLSVPGRWPELAETGARLTHFHIPRS